MAAISLALALNTIAGLTIVALLGCDAGAARRSYETTLLLRTVDNIAKAAEPQLRQKRLESLRHHRWHDPRLKALSLRCAAAYEALLQSELQQAAARQAIDQLESQPAATPATAVAAAAATKQAAATMLQRSNQALQQARNTIPACQDGLTALR